MDAVWVCEEDLNRLGKDGDQIHNVTLFARDKGCPAGGDQSALVQLCRAPQPSADAVPTFDEIWQRIGADPQLAHARKVLSIHELRTILQHTRGPSAK